MGAARGHAPEPVASVAASVAEQLGGVDPVDIIKEEAHGAGPPGNPFHASRYRRGLDPLRRQHPSRTGPANICAHLGRPAGHNDLGLGGLAHMRQLSAATSAAAFLHRLSTLPDIPNTGSLHWTRNTYPK